MADFDGDYFGPVGVDWPGQRGDVLNALVFLSQPLAALEKSGSQYDSMSLTDAVHWLVDDTFWDLRDTRDSIATVLRDEKEALAVARVVASVVYVAERHVNSTDAGRFADPQWSNVLQVLAHNAATLIGR